MFCTPIIRVKGQSYPQTLLFRRLAQHMPRIRLSTCLSASRSLAHMHMADRTHLYPPPQVDRLYNWKSVPDSPIRDAFKRQKDHVMKEFDDRSSQVFLQLNEQARGQTAEPCAPPSTIPTANCCVHMHRHTAVRL
jgi:hypothetical protein